MSEAAPRAAYGTYSQVRRYGKEQSRRALMDATCDLVLLHGLHAVTIDKIVAHAALSRPTFYLHFQSRDGVFEALRRAMVEILDGIYDQLAGIATADHAAVEHWVLHLLAACRLNRKLILTLMQVGTSPGLTFDSIAYYQSVIIRLSGRFAQFRAAQLNAAINAEALIILMQLEGVIRHVAVKDHDQDDRSFARPITRNVLLFVSS